MYESSIGTGHQKYQMDRHYVTLLRGPFLFRGLKSTVTKSVEPMVLSNTQNMSN